MGPRVDRLVLIGLRRSGKTFVGRVVATKIGWTLVDTDEIVQATTGRSPADWITTDGIEAFRRVESDAVASVARVRHAVVATGGGVPLSPKNREILRPGALIAYLRADPWILAERARGDDRPAVRPPIAGRLVTEEPFVHFAERDALYRSFCDVVVDAARPEHEVAAALLDALTSVREPTLG